MAIPGVDKVARCDFCGRLYACEDEGEDRDGKFCCGECVSDDTRKPCDLFSHGLAEIERQYAAALASGAKPDDEEA